jgi:dihydroxyacid dehydratase/phosphogluconate dehydratase
MGDYGMRYPLPSRELIGEAAEKVVARYARFKENVYDRTGSALKI